MQNDNELISVIIPVYGVEKYLNKCIQSILSQTYTNLEIILIDDGSPDNCPFICDQYARQDFRVKVIHKINEGLSSARNAGLDIASGQYITFIDSDDWISEDFIHTLYGALKSTNSQISVGNTQIVHVDASINETDLKRSESLQIFTSFEAVVNMYQHTKGLSLQFVTVWNNLYEARLFNTLRFPKGKNNEDEFVNYKLFFLANQIVYSSKKIYYYFIRNDSIMRSEYSLSRLVKLEALEERILFFDNIREKKLMNKSLYLYYHQLLYHLYMIKFTFPNEQLIYESLQVKHNKLSREMLTNDGINLKEKLIVFLFFLFPKLYKYK